MNAAVIGLGPVGLRVADELLARGHRLRLAADVNPALVGTELRGLLPAAPAGLLIQHADAAEPPPELEAVLVTTGSDLAQVAPTLLAWLARGLAVVSSCEELLWPWLRHPDLAGELHAAALQGGGRLCASGVNPGFAMDLLPLALSGACRRVEHVLAERVQDASPRRLPFQRKIGAGLDPEAFAQRAAAGSLRHVGLAESLHLLTTRLGFDLCRWEETLEPVLAKTELACALGAIPAGHAAGVRQVARGWAQVGGEEREVARLVFQAAIAQEEPMDRIQLSGDPDLELRLPGALPGDGATASLLVGTARVLRAAPPGLHTPADLPLPHWRPARGSEAS